MLSLLITRYTLICYKFRVLTPEPTHGMAVPVQSRTKAHDIRTSENDWHLLYLQSSLLARPGKKTDTPVLCSSSFTIIVFVELVVSLNCVLYTALYMQINSY